MRLDVLDRGHSLGTKALFAFIRAVSRQRVPDVVKTLKYRPDFFGTPMSAVFQEAMRGSSEWSIGDRELMASFVSEMNECEFCTKAHDAVASKILGNAKVEAVLADLETAPIEQPLRATLKFLRKVTKDHAAVTVNDVETVFAAGVTRSQIEDALAVCFAFNVINRLADTFEFTIPPAEAFRVGAKRLLSRGYSR